ncbi:MAG: Fur family transcriptional regulator, partial [Desulfomonilaceae bacterium]
IRKLEMAGTQKRFDGTTENHYHVRCVNCGRVEDLNLPTIISINDAAKAISGYQIFWHALEFEGLCPECHERRSKTQTEALEIKKINTRRNH